MSVRPRCPGQIRVLQFLFFEPRMDPPLSGSTSAPDPPRREDRLDSWKEIAGYLNRSVRTLYRWEKDEGLPVHRHQHKELGSVFAYKSELDAWVSARSPEQDFQPPSDQTARARHAFPHCRPHPGGGRRRDWRECLPGREPAPAG